jgi:choline dehydrogenase-like flavoprotein
VVAESFDYVVVGGGSAGCLVAAALGRAGASVLVCELGDPAEDHPETFDADGYKDAFINDRVIWERFSTRMRGTGGRRVFLGSGRGVGGSAAVNGMVYTRGDREDFDAWPTGWRWDDVVDDFAAIERLLGVRPRPHTRFTRAFVAGAEAAGFRRSDDLNDGDLAGVIGAETMSYEGDRRRNSYVAALRPAMEEGAPISLWTRTRVLRVDFDGTRAAGVTVRREGGTTAGERRVRARRDVVLAAGALETPKLLMLSGVGPAAELGRHGIPLVADAPEVGAHLHDHPNVVLFFRGKAEVDAHYPQLYGFHRARPESSHLSPRQSDTCYVAYPARSSFREAAMRMIPTLLPAFLYGGWSKGLIRGLIRALFWLPPVRRFIDRMWGIVVILGKPVSRGRVTLAGKDPTAPAVLDPAWLDAPEDVETLERGVALARRIAGSEPLTAFGSRDVLPGPLNGDRLRRWIRHNVITTYHYAGTCRMGDDPEASACDPDLRLRGVEGVRIADASAIPETPVSALNAPSMLVGYRAGRRIVAELGVADVATEASPARDPVASSGSRRG